MGFKIRNNLMDLNAHVALLMAHTGLNNSMESLATGLRINKAADDASGLQIADSLGFQANTLNQSIRNANDSIATLQIADKAMDEQVKIVNEIKVKAIQSAQDGQSFETRQALQQDIVKLLDELDNIANTTKYNGKGLLNGDFTNKKFQIGSYSTDVVNVSIDATTSNKIGNTRFETGMNVTAAAKVTLVLKSDNGLYNVKLESVKISYSAGTGIGVLAEVINKNKDLTGVKASWQVLTTGKKPIASGVIKDLKINGVTIGDIDVKANDADGNLVAAINKMRDQTGVEAYTDNAGRLNLRSLDGRGVVISASSGLNSSANVSMTSNYGRLTLTRLDARDIVVEGDNSKVGFNSKTAEATINLRSIRGNFSIDEASAIGAFANAQIASQASTYTAYKGYSTTTTGGSNGSSSFLAELASGTPAEGYFGGSSGSSGSSTTTTSTGTTVNKSTVYSATTTKIDYYAPGVTTLKGAMAVMDIADSAMKILDKIRSDLGATQNQVMATINNISVTKVNVKAAESQIRDIDFAAESARFQKYSILAISGSYAMAQANVTQKNITTLLQ